MDEGASTFHAAATRGQSVTDFHRSKLQFLGGELNPATPLNCNSPEVEGAGLRERKRETERGGCPEIPGSPESYWSSQPAAPLRCLGSGKTQER